jgi:hypothetical protein
MRIQAANEVTLAERGSTRNAILDALTSLRDHD